MIKYNLHDSLIEKIDYFTADRRVEIQIELCNWQQDGYKDSDPEIIGVYMIFDEVEKYELSLKSYEFCGNEILEVIEMDDNTMKIVFLTDDNAETIIIKAKRISFRNG